MALSVRSLKFLFITINHPGIMYQKKVSFFLSLFYHSSMDGQKIALLIIYVSETIGKAGRYKKCRKPFSQ